MNWWKKGLFVIVLGSVALFGAATFASAERVGGTGKLEAKGDGAAIVEFQGRLEATGTGNLWVRDIRGDAAIDVAGYGKKKEFSDGWVEYIGLKGNAVISGTHLTVAISGSDIELNVAGRGRALLWGEGTYDATGKTDNWDAAKGARLTFGARPDKG